MSLSRISLIFLFAATDILGQDFGSPIDEDQTLQITAVERETVKATISMFDVYLDDNDKEKIALRIKVPVEPAQSDEDTRKIYIIDFRQYSPLSNPVVNGSISNELISNCTNFQFSGLQSLADQFDDDEDAVTTENPFFEPELINEDDSYYIVYGHDGLLSEFNYCTISDDESRSGVWSSVSDSSGKLKHSTALFVNEIIVRREQTENEISYRTAYYSTSFKLTWSISQYIIVTALVASQRRVIPEMMYASVSPMWENGVVTDNTLVHIAIRTTLENAYHNHLMMVFVKDSNSGVFVVPDGPSFDARNMPPTSSDLVPCQPHSNYVLEGLEQDNYLDCQQTWEFDVVLPPEVSAYQEVEGVFSFKLQLYECDDLSSSSLDCGPVSDITETIAVDITLDTVVQVVAEQENTLGLEVTAIRNKDNTADFLSSQPLSRGIYHREDVVLYIQPTQDINRVKASDLISQHGLILAAFLVCFHSEIEIGSRMGCLEVDPQYRYIPYIEEDLSVSLQGKMYHRTDFEATKQSLTSHYWDTQQSLYVIEFKNLALSAKTRLYRMTMIFRLNYTDTSSDIEARKRRGITLSQPLTFRKRDSEVNSNVTIPSNSDQDITHTIEQPINDNAINPDINSDKMTTDSSTYTAEDDDTTIDDSSNSEESDINSSDNSAPKSSGVDDELGAGEGVADDGGAGEGVDDDGGAGEGVDGENDATSLGTSVKIESCPEGTNWESPDEDCKPSEASRTALLTPTLLFVTLLIVVSL